MGCNSAVLLDIEGLSPSHCPQSSHAKGASSGEVGYRQGRVLLFSLALPKLLAREQFHNTLQF